MIQNIPKVSIKDSIATKLLKRVFGIYIVIAVIVTLIHVVAEYYHTKKSIIRELKIIYQTIEDGLVLSLWDFDLVKTQSIISGGVILPSVTGISVEDELGKIVGEAGKVYHPKKNISETQGLMQFLKWGESEHVYVYSGDIQNLLDQKKVKIGRINIYSDRSVVFERIQVGFFFLILNSFIKSVALWIIFLLLSRKYIQRPLYILTNATTQLDLDNLEHIKIDIKLSGHNEFKVLEKSFKQMTEKLLDSRTSLQKLNTSLNAYKNHLELMVKERTKELTAANASLKNEIDNHKRTQEKLYLAKEEAEMASVYKSEFLANMSHEIRTPMNAIIGLTHLVLKTELNERQADFLNKINTSAGSLLRIINDILDFTKIEAGKLEIENISFNLDAVLENLSNIIIYKAEEKGLEILFNVEPDIPRWLIGDALRLEQILSNLFSNALKFTSKGEIILTATVTDKDKENVSVEFRVQDSGIGMTQKEIKKLFQSFTQADGSTTRKYGGTGLGLSICKNLVQLMKGNIRVTSEPGAGSTFIFNLPFMIDHEKSQKSTFLLNEFEDKRCLIVDDNEFSRMIFTQNLESFKFQCKAVGSGKEAIKELENTSLPYDLVILDWKMPEMDGIETAKKIRAHKNLVKMPQILMVSAYGREEVMHRAKEAGLSSFLLKPVNRSILFNAIVDIIGTQNKSIPYKRNQQAHKKDENLNKRKGAHILVVEDNEVNQEIVFELLNTNGFHVSIANDGLEAINAVEKNKFDLIFMDIQMPNMDGLEASRRIREKGYTDLPIIAMTAHAMSGDRDKSIEAGMNDHITKPLDPIKLNETLIRWIPEKSHPENACILSETDSQQQNTDNATLPDSIPGISIENGLTRSNGNAPLFLRLLGKFYNCYSRKDLEILKTWIQNDEIKQAKSWVHTLKGVSGNIGAEDLYNAAVAIEYDIKTGAVNIEASLESFSNAYLSLLKSLESLNFQQKEKADLSQKKTTTPQALQNMFNSLSEAIQKRKPKPCKQIINDIKKYELPEILTQNINDLSVCLNHYQFKQASTILANIQEKYKTILQGEDNEQ
ncbi:multi-sensor hybrid histidine kinase [Candidatus Magnetomorum sp. HK-1]|nr:multi-sensor hybrid histidine kinase [Candidatus Magnetomorum sp. HK-1]